MAVRPDPLRFRGAVLTGGASRRMGRDKAFIEHDGRPLVRIAADALLAAGAVHVTCIGGDLDRLRSLGLDATADRHPGEGPLGGLIDALRLTPGASRPGEDDVVMVLTCDLPLVDGSVIEPIVAALGSQPAADAAAPRFDGRPQLLSAAYRAVRVLPRAEAAFAAGLRAVRAGLDGAAIVEVTGLDAAKLTDADTPEALAQVGRLRTGHHPGPQVAS